jgi:Skp family chaperone for outer membrane proteins
MKKSPFHHLTSKLVPVLLSLGMALSATAGQLKVATVNMTTLLNEYHKTKEAEQEEEVETENIRKLDSERVSSIQALVEELRKLQKEFSDPSLSEEKRKSIAKVANDRKATLDALQKEREEFLGRSRRALTQKMVGLMDEIRVEVIAAVNAHAATQDADFVFDESGLTTNQVPFLVYVRNKVDITPDVLKNLNKDTPAATVAPE